MRCRLVGRLYRKRMQFSSNYLPSAAPIRHFARAIVTLLLRRDTGLMVIMVQEENKENSATSLPTAINYFQITNFAGI